MHEIYRTSKLIQCPQNRVRTDNKTNYLFLFFYTYNINIFKEIYIYIKYSI